jgi:hypothetical protein
MRHTWFVTMLVVTLGAPLAAQDRQPTTPQEWMTEFKAGIREKCEKEWPDDYRMQAYCIKQQDEALGKFLGRNTAIYGTEKLKKLRTRCLAEWSTPATRRDGSDRFIVDFRMANYCEEQQLKALASLGDR